MPEFRPVPATSITRLGYIPRWLVCGPFGLEDEGEVYRLYRMGRLDVPDDDPLGGEESIEPIEGMRHASSIVPEGKVEWQSVRADSPHLGFSSLLDSRGYGIAYGATYVSSPRDQMMVCDFDPQMLGALILDHRRLNPERGPVPLPLAAGVNLILVKVVGGSPRGMSWGATMAFHRAKEMGSSGIFGTAPRPTGFFRGSSESPEMEVEFDLVNTSGREAFDLALNLVCPETDTEIFRSVPVLRTAETSKLLLGLPVPAKGLDKGKIFLEVTVGEDRGKISGAAEGIKPPGDFTVFLGTGFHCDPIWTNTQSMYNDVSLHNVTQYLDFCRADPEHRIILHELDYLKPYYDFYPEDRDYLRALAKEGRVILGGSYNEPNEKNISGEHLIRNILYGRLFATSQFGSSPKVYHAWDVFGHVPQLSQVLAKSGFKGIVWSKVIRGFPPVFRHMSLDGTTLLHRRVSYGFTTGSFREARERAYTGLKEMESLGHGCDLRMNCSDFKSPTGWMLGRTAELKSLLPRIESADPTRFFEAVMKEESGGLPIPVTSRDATQYHIGTSQSRIELKIANRLGEVGLYNAELLGTLASLLGRTYPDLSLDKAWRQLLFNDHHDAITGTSCDKSYLDMLQGYREALSLAAQEVAGALEHIAMSIDTQAVEGIPLVVFNTLNWDRSDIVRHCVTFKDPVASFEVLDPGGKRVPYCLIHSEAIDRGLTSATVEFLAEGVPSVGYSVYRIRPLPEGSAASWRKHAGSATIENDYFRVTVDPMRGGGISSILDRKGDREIVSQDSDRLANEIVAVREKSDRVEPSWEFYTTGERMFSGNSRAQVDAYSCGPTQRMVVVSTLGETCRLVREIWLRRGLPRIDFRTEIQGYNGQDDLFCALFPQGTRGAAPTFEERFGAVVKHRGRGYLDYRTSGNNNFSDCAIHSSQNFFDYGTTTKIRFVDYEARTVSSFALGSIAMVLPHSKEVQLIARRLQTALVNRGVLTTPFLDDDDKVRRGKLAFEDSSEAAEKNLDLPNTNFRLSVGLAGNNCYSVSVLGMADELLLRKFRDRVAKIGFDFLLLRDRDVPEGWEPVPVLILEARNTELLEKAVDFLVEGLSAGDVILPQHVNALGEAGVDDWGTSILNRGNMANTVEPDGTMTLLLKHSSNWSRVHMEGDFVPEKKEHVFHYSMYPHNGSWREARSYQRGWEYNVPLLCHQAGRHKGPLPPVQSFLMISPGNIVLSALKPAGNPVAAFQSEGSDPLKGLVIRVYEAEGQRTDAKFALALPLDRVWRTDLMEGRTRALDFDGGSFTDMISPFSIETYEAKPSQPLVEGKPTELTPPREPVQPVYGKYWKHNLGAAPVGYQAVALSLQGSPVNEAGGRGTSINRMQVCVSNDYVDRTISGDIVLEMPAGWRVEPGKIWCEVPPLEHRCYEFIFSFSGLRRCGLVKARMEHDGQVLEDVIEVGEQSKLTYTGGGSVYQDVLKVQIERAVRWQVIRRGRKACVRVSNPYNEGVDGGVALITPLETWSAMEVGDYSLCPMGPAVLPFHLGPKSEEILEFDLGGENPHYWAYAKLYYMGRTEYRRVI